MMKKMLVGLLIAMVGVGFAAEFNYKTAEQIMIRQKDYAALKTYITTNNEIASQPKSTIQYRKVIYILCKLCVKANVEKTLTVANYVATCEQELASAKIEKSWMCYLLYNLRRCFTDKTIADGSKMAISYYEANKSIFAESNGGVENLMFSYLMVNNYKGCLALIDLNKSVNKGVLNMLYKDYKRIPNEDKAELVKAIGKNPVKFIKDANNLNGFVNIVNTLTSQEYDSVVNPVIITVNRNFYSKLVVNDQWKQALVNLQLVMKSRNIQ